MQRPGALEELKQMQSQEGLLRGVPIVAQQVKNLTSTYEEVGLIPGPVQWVRDMALLPAVV